MTRVNIGIDDWSWLRTRPKPVGNARGRIRLVDLFSGCGGLTLGVVEAARLRHLAVDVALAVDSNDWIANTYRTNFAPEHGCERGGDVRHWFDRQPGQRPSTLEKMTVASVGKVDVLVGGPPCQGHSTLNNYTRGDDPKNELYDTMIRATELLRPKFLLIENVPALVRDKRGTLDKALERLRRLGYRADAAIVCMDRIGVPQRRKRHVLIAHSSRKPDVEAAVLGATVEASRTVRWAISDLLGTHCTGLLDIPAKMTQKNLRRARFLLDADIYDLPNNRRPKCQRSHHKYKSMYGRLRWDEPAQTITTGFGSPGQGRYLHPSEPRTLTPHEAARLQFLPDWFDLGALPHRKLVAEVIGNAVPPKLAFAVMSYLLDLETLTHDANGKRATVPAACVRQPAEAAPSV